MSQEIIIGIVRAAGTDAEVVLDYLSNALRDFDYEVQKIKVSESILNDFSQTPYQDYENQFERTTAFMDLGNEIREKFSSSVLMEGVAAYIYQQYRGTEPRPLGKQAYIIDSIKHPEEVTFLRDTYGDGFHLLGIWSSRKKRESYLKRKGMGETRAQQIIARDESEANEYGQHTRDVFQDSDYFMNADTDPEKIKASVDRLVDLLFGNPFITPTFSEYAMFRAYVASLRSADLSRQVGAVVVRDDEVLAEGVNDCPKAGGGIYWQSYQDEFEQFTDIPGGRDWTLHYDSNRKQQEELARSILASLGIEQEESNVAKVRKGGLGQLTEYGRMVHAEMEALMMCARNGIPTRDCNMYVTTFPCHNCAKHIIDAGIHDVFYIEPYPKSHALDFYNNEISSLEEPDGEEEDKKVRFRPFFGVGPHRFIDVFSMKSTRWRTRVRKDSSGKATVWSRKDAALRNPMKLLTYLSAEQKAFSDYYEVKELMRKEKNGDQY